MWQVSVTAIIWECMHWCDFVHDTNVNIIRFISASVFILLKAPVYYFLDIMSLGYFVKSVKIFRILRLVYRVKCLPRSLKSRSFLVLIELKLKRGDFEHFVQFSLFYELFVRFEIIKSLEWKSDYGVNNVNDCFGRIIFI